MKQQYSQTEVGELGVHFLLDHIMKQQYSQTKKALELAEQGLDHIS